MVSGRIDHHDRLNWNHTSALIATIAKWSMHKTKREDVDPAKINPYTSKKRRGVPLESIHDLKAFVPKHKQRPKK